MDFNVLTICITVIVALLIASATILECFEKSAELHRPRSLAEILNGVAKAAGDGKDRE